MAETTNLLHPSQIGGRLKKSAVDAALLLTNEVQANRRLKRKTTTLFLDVKGAFDHVAKNQLLGILQKLQLPSNLVAWTSSFLSNRTLRLSFDGQMEKFSKLETGIPQGSPISPILFLIYIRDLFPRIAAKVLSYIDDISLTVASTSLRKNIRILEREAAKIFEMGAKNAIEFDLEKTELMHFTTGKEAKTANLRLPNGKIINPKEIVKWLGITFDPGLTFKKHVATRTSQVRSAFQRMTRLANTAKGLSPFAVRQLYLACVTSVADYGSPIWWRGQAQFERPLQALQNLALRKILGVFKTAPIVPMEVEAALQPPNVRLNASIRNYAIRALKLSPKHPINEELSKLPTIPSPKPMVQLERIRASVQDLIDPDELEPLQHFIFPPWNRETPYAVNISPLPKEEAAQVHNSNPHLGADDVTIYTDASSMPGEDSNGVGVGLVVLNYNQGTPRVVHTGTINLGNSQLVYNGELEGITQAVEYAGQAAKPGQSYHIYSDNQAGLNRLRTPSDDPGQACQIRTSKAAELAQSKGATITINWVPGHTDVHGNELADSLAKQATTQNPSSTETSFAILGQKAKEVTKQEWESVLGKYDERPSQNSTTYRKQFPWQVRSKIQLPRGTKREIASSFFQLKLGHGYLKSYLHRLGHTESDLCRCGRRETPAHLLLSCKEAGVAKARAKLRDEIKGARLSLPLLLHTKIGIEKTLEFLQQTRICTRKWHLERMVEEGQEEESEEEREEEREEELEEEE